MGARRERPTSCRSLTSPHQGIKRRRRLIRFFPANERWQIRPDSHPSHTVEAEGFDGAVAIVSPGFSGCDNDRDQPTPPKPADPTDIANTIRQYFDAYNAGDVAALNATSCTAAQRESATVPPSKTILTAVEDPIVEGTSVLVPVEVTVQSDGAAPTPSQTQISLVAEDGLWGVCMFERPSE